MTYAATAIMILGVAITFIPAGRSSHLREVTGALVIVGGLFTLGFAGYMRRRLR
jgi:hypothetical protein